MGAHAVAGSVLASRSLARHEQPVEAQRQDGAGCEHDRDRAAEALQVGAGEHRVAECEPEGAETREVEAAPALLSDPLAGVEGRGEREADPGGDDAHRDAARLPARRAGDEHRQHVEVEERVEEQRPDVEHEHREPRPRESAVEPEQRLRPLRRQQAGAHREPEPDRQRQQAEGDEAGGARDEPRDGKPGAHATDTTRRGVFERHRAERNGRAGVRDVQRGELGTRGDIRLGLGEAGDRERRRVRFRLGGVGRDDGDRERAGDRGLARLRVDEVVERARRAEAARVASRGRHATVGEREHGERLAWPARIADGDPPRAAFGRFAAHGDVAAEVDEASAAGSAPAASIRSSARPAA